MDPFHQPKGKQVIVNVFFVFFFDSGQCGDECRLSVIFVVSSFVTQYPLPRLVYPTVDRRSTCGTPLLVVVFVCFGWPPGEEDARDDLSLCLSLWVGNM